MRRGRSSARAAMTANTAWCASSAPKKPRNGRGDPQPQPAGRCRARKRGRPKKVAEPAPQAPEQETAATVAAIRCAARRTAPRLPKANPSPPRPTGARWRLFPGTGRGPDRRAGDGHARAGAGGPGAGKTRVLVGRLQYLLAHDVPASQLLAVTFTRRAAQEMRQRLQAPAGDGAVPAALPRCDTLHALA